MDFIDKFLVGLRIKKIRNDKNLSMEAFAEKVGVAGKSTVNEWEKGRSTPNSQTLKKIAELGAVSVGFIIYGSLQEYVKKVLYDHIQDENLFQPLKNYLYTTSDFSSFENAAMIFDESGKVIPPDKYDAIIFESLLGEMSKVIDNLIPKIMKRVNEKELTYNDESDIISEAISVINIETMMKSDTFEGMFFLYKKALNELPFVGASGDFSSEKSVSSLKAQGYSEEKILELQYKSKLDDLKMDFSNELNKLHDEYLKAKKN